MIPKIIHYNWISDNTSEFNELPCLYNEIYKHNKEINSNFTYKLWTNKGDFDYENNELNIDKFLSYHYPNIYNIYIKTDIGVQKSDLCRLAILYHYGGLYFDLDILFLKRLDDLLDFNSNKINISFEPKEQTLLLYNNDHYICNAFFATPPKNKLIYDMIELIINIYQQHEDKIFNKFNIFGSDIYRFILGKNNELLNIIDREKVYPINDLKFDNLNSSKNDHELVNTGIYNDNIYMIHYWLHSSFEGKNIINNFKYNYNITIHENVYNFICKLYPNNKYIKKNNY